MKERLDQSDKGIDTRFGEFPELRAASNLPHLRRHKIDYRPYGDVARYMTRHGTVKKVNLPKYGQRARVVWLRSINLHNVVHESPETFDSLPDDLKEDAAGHT